MISISKCKYLSLFSTSIYKNLKYPSKLLRILKNPYTMSYLNNVTSIGKKTKFFPMNTFYPSIIGHENIFSESAKPQKQKKLICISPGGFKGFYMMGVVAYIKTHYDLSDFIFSGASAGAWNAILCSYQGNITELIQKVIGNNHTLQKNDSIHDYKNLLKQRILENSNKDEYNLSSIHIGVTTLQYGSFTPLNIIKERTLIKSNNSFIKTSIFSDFVDLEDAINCCIASSHVPLITGRLMNKYKNLYTFDGGFSKYPYLHGIEPTLYITPDMWDPPKNKSLFNIENYTTLLCKEKYNFTKLYENGYKDTEKNSKILDKIFSNKNNKKT